MKNINDVENAILIFYSAVLLYVIYLAIIGLTDLMSLWNEILGI